MKVFLVWVAVILVILFLYCLYLWKFKREKERFRTRITVILLILTLLPVIPVTFFLCGSLTKSFDTLVSGNIEETLDSGITGVTGYLDKMAVYISSLLTNSDIDGTAKKMLIDSLKASIYNLEFKGDSLSISNLMKGQGSPGIAAVTVTSDDINDLRNNRTVSRIIEMENTLILFYLQPETELKAYCLLYRIQPEISKALINLQNTYNAYGPLFQLKETVLEAQFIWNAGVFFIALVAVLAVYIARVLSKNITGPVIDLVNGFSRVKEGDFSTHLETKAQDEIGELIESFNVLTKELKISRERIIQAERLAAWRDVARQISHEIKNPLTPIQLSLHRIRKKITLNSSDKETVDECFQTINEEVESLRRIASEFSEFARMPKPVKKPVNLSELVVSVVALFAENDKNVEIEQKISNDKVTLKADEEQFRRMLINLLKNAVEACPESNGKISVSIIEHRENPGGNMDQVSLTVKDNGSGMNEETMKNIFTPYFTTKRAGTGLGMPIVKRIVDEHNAEITIDSRPGNGATVRITFKNT